MPELLESQKLNSEINYQPQKEKASDVCDITIEREIMKRFLDNKTSTEQEMEWIKKFSEIFRKFFDNNKDEIIEKYHINPEEAYAFIEDNIYESSEKIFQ